MSINGVGGGPVFAPLDDWTPAIAGIISSYSPNVIDGDTLPGLLQARNVSAFHEALKTVRSLDDARKKALTASPTPPVLSRIRKRREK